jgi:hypothetical protein
MRSCFFFGCVSLSEDTTAALPTTMSASSNGLHDLVHVLQQRIFELSAELKSVYQSIQPDQLCIACQQQQAHVTWSCGHIVYCMTCSKLASSQWIQLSGSNRRCFRRWKRRYQRIHSISNQQLASMTIGRCPLCNQFDKTISCFSLIDRRPPLSLHTPAQATASSPTVHPDLRSSTKARDSPSSTSRCRRDASPLSHCRVRSRSRSRSRSR